MWQKYTVTLKQHSQDLQSHRAVVPTYYFVTKYIEYFFSGLIYHKKLNTSAGLGD